MANVTNFSRYEFEFRLEGFSMMIFYFVGVIGNGILIGVTFRPSSNLKTHTNVLIAILAIFDFLTSLFSTGVTAMMAFQINWVPHSTCILAMAPGYFTSTSSFVMMTAIGFDRLLAMEKPIFYKTVEKRKYVATYCICAVVFGAYNVIPLLVTMDNQILIPICALPFIWLGNAGFLSIIPAFILQLCTVCIYAKAMHTSSHLGGQAASASKNRMLVTMVIILTIYMTTQIISAVLLAVAEAIKASDQTLFSVTFIIGSAIAFNQAFVHHSHPIPVNTHCNPKYFFANNTAAGVLSPKS